MAAIAEGHVTVIQDCFAIRSQGRNLKIEKPNRSRTKMNCARL